ncbi:MAG: class I SAM-dependent methyltransferase [Dyella sp.]|uniref:class I SAM-dependent methyltransferase n=1 Tax=Dyella sp. TaxID=1869338 RepID=UPI003F80C289
MSETVYQPAGNFYDKYNTRNPIARALMQGFLRAFDELVVEAGEVGTALEIGCGEGELSMRLARGGWQVEGCDIAEEAVLEARRRASSAGLNIPFERQDIANCGQRYQKHDLVVCCEVMEHLEDPRAALQTLAALSRGHVLVSVPREPVWRLLNMARARYLGQFGNTPGHIQHWSRRGFVSLLESQFDVVKISSPLPWTMALCRVRSS